ncbi:DUF6790 family protein [Ancylobacter amanitiformis]|uniref:Permease n=1 Tax=Ancylobacter amanitiformis TaxID=217069 RepID=A0ABU0LNI9_9HYPH|nr:DUF6790 family protein [Ancylobacter amanitiformis]MDQ0510178.1 hypothetical protein [Ancylobacter amanitiformis]
MIQAVIAFILGNLPEILFVSAFLAAALTKSPAYYPARLLGWLLLSAGIAYVWAGFFHIVFPHMAAASIGWEVSPFQFEIGVADAAIGIVAILSFWRPLDFKAPVVGYYSLFSFGVAYGHFREAFEAGDTSKNNFGLLLVITLIYAVLLPVLYVLARRKNA